MSIISCHAPLNFIVMGHSTGKRITPCHVHGCRFVGTNIGGMKNHLRAHPPELRVQCFRKQQVHCEHEIHPNADDIDNDAFHFNFNFHGNGEEDNDDDDENNDNDGEVDNHGQRSS